MLSRAAGGSNVEAFIAAELLGAKQVVIRALSKREVAPSTYAL